MLIVPFSPHQTQLLPDRYFFATVVLKDEESYFIDGYSSSMLNGSLVTQTVDGDAIILNTQLWTAKKGCLPAW
jgi:hypothetical protein